MLFNKMLCWRSRIKPWSNIHGWYYIVYVVSLYSIMDVIKDVEEVGLNHGAINMDDTI